MKVTSSPILCSLQNLKSCTLSRQTQRTPTRTSRALKEGWGFGFHCELLMKQNHNSVFIRIHIICMYTLKHFEIDDAGAMEGLHRCCWWWWVLEHLVIDEGKKWRHFFIRLHPCWTRGMRECFPYMNNDILTSPIWEERSPIWE